MKSLLEKEFKYYLEHQQEFVKKYKGKFLAFKNQELLGVFNSELEAFEEISKKYKLGTFLIQRCEPGVDSYTQTYHSRVVFT